jgi:hypothetical protein
MVHINAHTCPWERGDVRRRILPPTDCDDPILDDLKQDGIVPVDDLHIDHLDEADVLEPDADTGDVRWTPGWMSYRPGTYLPPSSLEYIQTLVATYNLMDGDVASVASRIDMLTLYLWYIHGPCSEVSMKKLLVNRSFAGTIPFVPCTIDGLRLYVGFKQVQQEQGWNDTTHDHWEFQQIVTCSALGCTRCSLYSTLFPPGSISVPTCRGIEFPTHRQKNRRGPCNTPLTVPPVRIRGLLVWKPQWLLMYKSPEAYMREFMLRPNYADMNEHWRNRPPQFDPVTGEEIGCDFYDFGVWRSFHAPGGRIDWTRRGNALLLANMDWYQPFKHTVASLGLVWMANLCIPRAQRYKRHNVMLIAVFPGTSEKKQRCDRLLEPLARDLCRSWDSEPDIADPVQRLALAYISADAPAVRKFAGFGVVTGSAGCLCCHKIYSRYVNANGNWQQEYHNLDACRLYQLNASGDSDDDTCENCHRFGRADHEDPDAVERLLLTEIEQSDAYVLPAPITAIIFRFLDPPPPLPRTDRLRTREEMTQTAYEWRDAPNTHARKEKVHALGVTWTPMYLLPYFDPTTMVGIDALHHMWHGVVQALMVFWLAEGILSPEDVARLQAIITATPSPYDIGAMRTKLMDRFSRMSAADQMQFVLVYSDTLFPLVIDGPDLKVWEALSRCAHLLSQTSFTPSELIECERAAYEYNRILSDTYNGRAFAAKVHELTHCARTIRQGGPGHVTHTFMFEGLNGSAQQIMNNVHAIQLSIMRRWTRRNTTSAIAHLCMDILHKRLTASPSSDSVDDLHRLRRVLEQLWSSLSDIGTDMCSGTGVDEAWFDDRQVDLFIRHSQLVAHCYGHEFLPGGIVDGRPHSRLTRVERTLLTALWLSADMTAPSGDAPSIPTVCTHRGRALSMGGELFTSIKNRSRRSSYIIMRAIGDDGTDYDYPGQVSSYIEIDTDVVPRGIAALMTPPHGEDMDDMDIFWQNDERHRAMESHDLAHTFVTLGPDDTYIAKRRKHCYAIVNWFDRDPTIGSCAWMTNSTTPSIIPVHRIKSRFVPVHLHADKSTFHILPIPRRIHLAASYAHD